MDKLTESDEKVPGTKRCATCGQYPTDPQWLAHLRKKTLMNGLMGVWVSLVLLTAWFIPWYFYNR